MAEVHHMAENIYIYIYIYIIYICNSAIYIMTHVENIFDYIEILYRNI